MLGVYQEDFDSGRRDPMKNQKKDQIITAENLAEILRLERVGDAIDTHLVYIMLAAALVVGIVAGAGLSGLLPNRSSNDLEKKPNHHQNCGCADHPLAFSPEIGRRSLPIDARLGNAL